MTETASCANPSLPSTEDAGAPEVLEPEDFAVAEDLEALSVVGRPPQVGVR